jgi:hypothetical protein
MDEVDVQGPISEMPETILILIMSHLEFDEILRMTRINKMFNRYTKNKMLWELAYERHDQKYFGKCNLTARDENFPRESDTRQKSII